MHKAFSLCIPVTQEWTDDDVAFVAARLQEALNKATLRVVADKRTQEPIGILAQADGANA